MKVYRTLKFSSYKSAALIMNRHLNITDVKHYLGAYQLYSGDHMVAFYNENTFEMQVYVNLNSNK